MCKLIDTHDNGYELETCNVYKHLLKVLIQHAESCHDVESSSNIVAQAVEDLLKKMPDTPLSFMETANALITTATVYEFCKKMITVADKWRMHKYTEPHCNIEAVHLNNLPLL